MCGVPARPAPFSLGRRERFNTASVASRPSSISGFLVDIGPNLSQVTGARLGQIWATRHVREPLESLCSPAAIDTDRRAADLIVCAGTQEDRHVANLLGRCEL